jgi:hypothetical protein
MTTGKDITELDFTELTRLLRLDSGEMAKSELAAGFPIYYRSEDDTLDKLVLKEYPDGRRELVRFNFESGQEAFVSIGRRLPVHSAVGSRVPVANSILSHT